MTPPSPSGQLSTYTTRVTFVGRASAAAWAIAPPPEWPTRTIGPDPPARSESTTATTASTWSRSVIRERSASLDSKPGSVTACTRCPACPTAGATSSHDDPSNQKPGIRMMSIAGTYAAPRMAGEPPSGAIGPHPRVARARRVRRPMRHASPVASKSSGRAEPSRIERRPGGKPGLQQCKAMAQAPVSPRNRSAQAHPSPSLDAAPSSKLVAGLVVVEAILIAAYWILWFSDRALLRSSTAPVYYQFENAFPLADGWLFLCCLCAAWCLVRGRPGALGWLLCNVGAGIYLFGMDDLYDIEHGIWTSGAGGGIELAINLATLIFSLFVAQWTWRRRWRILDPDRLAP